MKKLITGLLLFLFVMIGIANAGFDRLTHHSRANCVNNESISWDWNNNWWLWVNSEHIDANSGTLVHHVIADWQLTWRAAAVHWGEGKGGWGVHGWHWMKDSYDNPVLVADEYVTDCSIYDGWWDRNQ